MDWIELTEITTPAKWRRLIGARSKDTKILMNIRRIDYIEDNGSGCNIGLADYEFTVKETMAHIVNRMVLAGVLFIPEVDNAK
jgi:hypothetical protein